MLTLQFPRKVKLIVAAIYRDGSAYEQIKKRLIRRYGKIDFQSRTLPFFYTDYYEKEMGPGLSRCFFSFKKLVDPSAITGVKLYCLKLERATAPDRKRLVNIDPGYVDCARLVLSTTKDFSHRIYLGKGVYAEVTLQYRDNAWQDLPSTFPDYRTAEYKKILTEIRRLYCEQIKKVESRE